MAEIKFTTERMKEVQNRLNDMRSQLTAACGTAENQLRNISGYIDSYNIKAILKGYVSNMEQIYSETLKNLNQLDGYLAGKIGSYTSIDQAGIESLSEVESILNGIEG